VPDHCQMLNRRVKGLNPAPLTALDSDRSSIDDAGSGIIPQPGGERP
jgi:hypothetical protein